MTPKLVVLDLDGTVVGYGLQLLEPSPAVVKAVAAVRDAGIPVAVATGRPVWDALPTINALGLADGLVSTTHGAITYDLGASRVVGRSPLDPAEAVRRFTAANSSTAFAVERDESGWYHTKTFNRNFASKWAGVLEPEELSAEPAVRLVARLPWVPFRQTAQPCPEAAELAATAGLDPALYQVEPGHNGWIDVGPAGVTKATGLDAIAGHYGVSPADTAVFGDGANDLPMFAWAGHAVALGQAVEHVKAAADEIAPSVEDDGVAVVLRRWFG